MFLGAEVILRGLSRVRKSEPLREPIYPLRASLAKGPENAATTKNRLPQKGAQHIISGFALDK